MAHRTDRRPPVAVGHVRLNVKDVGAAARVMALVVHPYITGAPHRLKYFRSALAHIQKHPGIVFWTGEQILDWYSAQRRTG